MHQSQHASVDRHGPVDPRMVSPWLPVNQILSRDAQALVNERILETRVDEAFTLEIDDIRMFWLTLARITELAVVQAGVYADGCEFQAAGDLLVNPRLIDVLFQGQTIPVVKKRHSGLSTQFQTVIKGDHPAAWLAREATTRVKVEALLPALQQALSSSGLINPAYLNDLRQRMCRVASTITFLTSWQIPDSTELYRRMRHMGSEGTAFILSNLCRFGKDRFEAMGEDIDKMVVNEPISTRFILDATTDGLDLSVRRYSKGQVSTCPLDKIFMRWSA